METFWNIFGTIFIILGILGACILVVQGVGWLLTKGAAGIRINK